MERAFKLSEIGSMQLACIKQLTQMKEEILANRKDRPYNRKASNMPSSYDVLDDIEMEIKQRKHWAMFPEEIVQVCL